MALQGEAPNTGAKYHQKYPRKTQRTRVPYLLNLVIFWGYFWGVQHSWDRRIFGPPVAASVGSDHFLPAEPASFALASEA